MTFTMGLQLHYLFLLLVLVSCSIADKAKDREECTNQLAGLATCLPYVGGTAKAPTPDCCTGLKQVLKNDKKCLCVIIRDRNDPDLGLNINATLALGLPSVCHATANVSQCPALLHLDPNSPEAQIFYQFDKSSNHAASSPAPSPAAGGNSMSDSGQGRGVKGTSDGGCGGKRWLALEVFSGGVSVLLYYFMI